MATAAASALDWLLESDEPGVAMQAKRDLLDDRAPADAARVLAGPKVRALLAGQQPDGGFGCHAYAKWRGAHWRLVSLVELGVPAGEPRCLAAAETVLAWLTGKGHRNRIPVIDGLTRRCGSQEGNALAVCSRLGLAADARMRLLAESLIEWQWPDGGWNCDRNATGYRSSFHESLAPMWGLHEYCVATGEPRAREAAERTADLLLEHRLFSRARHRRADPRLVRDDPLTALLALRLLPGARRARPDGPRGRPSCGRRARPGRATPAPGRALAAGRPLVEGAGREGHQRRGGRLGLGPQRARDPARAPRAAGCRPPGSHVPRLEQPEQQSDDFVAIRQSLPRCGWSRPPGQGASR
jgi:hypothetical protein